MPENLVKIQNISKKFRTDFWKKSFQALNDVSFSIDQGDLVGFLGANGAGKTTLIKIMLGLIHPDKGRVKFSTTLGVSPFDQKKQMGFLPESPYFYQDLTGFEFAQYLLQLTDVALSKADRHKILEKWFDRLKITHAMNRKIRFYSKGMLQRLGIITTLAHNPQLIILDEPLNGLDPLGRHEIKEIILEAHKAGQTIFFSSHILSDIEEICNKIVFLEKGQLIYQGPLDSIMNQNEEAVLYSILFNWDKVKDVESIIKLSQSYLKKNNFWELQVDQKNLNRILGLLVEHEVKLEQVRKIRKSLEQILYKTDMQVGVGRG